MPSAAQSIESILAAAVEMNSEAERRKFLDEACAGNVELKSRLEQLIENHFRAGSFLESSPAHGVLPEALGATVDEPITAAPGAVIGPYKLLEQIGEGGFGVVFLAEQTQPVRRKVALKVLKPGMDTRQVVARFEAERQALAIMDHPNIAKVYDGGATPSGHPYFVMELVKGVPITEFCDQNHLTPRQRLDLFVSVCQAVKHAHQKGIIHRDLKPSNVLVSRHDTTPVVKVIDFGVAKALGQELTDKTLFTGVAQMISTPLYMSPEQAGMSDLDIDTRSDIYSLGVMLYELLTGTTPFTKDRFKQAAYEEIRRIIREEEPPRPSTRLSDSRDSLPSISAQRHMEPANLTKLVRGELDWIVMKALAKDRNRRYESANGFAMDVQRYLADEPVQACPPSTGYRLRKFLRRKRRLLAAAGLVLASLAILAGSLAWMAWDRAARQQETEHGVVEALAHTEAYLDEGAKRMDNPLQWQMSVSLAEGALRRAEGVQATGRTTAELERRVSLARDQVELAQRESELVIELERILLDTAGNVMKGTVFDERLAVSRYAALLREYGVDIATPSEAAARVRSSRLREFLLAALHDWWRIVAAVGGEEKERLEALLFAVEPEDAGILKRWWAAERKRDADALAQLAATPAVQNLPALAIRNFARALRGTGQLPAAARILREAVARYPGDFWLNHDLGMVLLNQNPPRAEQAVRYMTAAVALRSNSPGAYNNLGLALVAAKDLDGGIRAYQAALHIDPNYFGCYNSLATALLLKNDARAAIGALETALKIDANHSGTHAALARALSRENDREGAVREFRAAIKIAPNNAAAHYNLGLTLWQDAELQNKKDFNEAIVEFQAAIKHDNTFVEAYTNLGIVYWQQGRFAESSEALRAAVTIDPSHAIANCNLGNTLRDMNDLPGAIRAYQSAIRSNPKYAIAQANLGTVFSRQRRSAEAAAAFREAIESDPNLVAAHWNLGNLLLFDLNDPEGAARAFQSVLKIAPNDASAQWNLGMALTNQGHFTDALAALQKAEMLGVHLRGPTADPAGTIREVEQFIALDANLVKLRDGQGRTANPREGLQLASLCARYKRLYATGAAWYADAFAAEPKAADDINAGHRYDAACAAAQAGCGRGLDAGNLTDAERARLRNQAFEWLQADLQVYAKFLHGNNQQERTLAQQRLEHWQRDHDLSDVRDLAAIVKLPPGERATWVKLWADVEIHLNSQVKIEGR